MQTSRELLAAVADKKGWRHARIARELGEDREFLDRIRHGQHCFTEEQAGSIAEWLGLEPLYVLACLRTERAKRKGVKSMWERIARMSV